MKASAIILIFILNCAGQTYDCVLENSSRCQYDFKKMTVSSYIDPYIITKAIAESQYQINSNITQTVNTVLGAMEITTAASVPNPVGSFVGGGTGNKAILQLTQFHGMKLSDITYVDIEYQTVITGGGNIPYLNFAVDLDCIFDEDVNTLTLAQLRARRRIIVWHSLFAGSTVPVGSGNLYSSTSAQTGFAIVGAPQLGMSANPTTYQTLNQFDYATYPNACIVNGVNGDGGLPRNKSNPVCVTGAALPGTATADCGLSMAGIFVNIGDSSNTSLYSVQIKKITIKDKTISFKEVY